MDRIEKEIKDSNHSTQWNYEFYTSLKNCQRVDYSFEFSIFVTQKIYRRKFQVK